MANVQELYDRFKDGGGGSKMVYPLENQQDYLGKMTFTPIDEKPVEIPESIGNLVDLGKDAIEWGYDAVLKRTTDYFDKITGRETEANTKGRTKLGEDRTHEGSVSKLSSDVTKAFKGNGEIKASTAFDENQLTLSKNKISLYLPRAIQIQDTVSYDNAFQLGLIGGAVEAGMQDKGGAGIVGTVAGVAASQAKAVGSLLGGDTSGMSRDAAGIIAGRVAARTPLFGDAVAGAVRGATRLTTNPNTRALFKDVPIRNFSFAFQLVPTSRAEARMIETIIKQFREELYPEALQAAGINIGYRFPNRFLIKVKYNNREIKGIRFLPVYMQSFNATYNAATGGMHSDGRFSAVDISMTFTETRAISKKDIEGGY